MPLDLFSTWIPMSPTYTSASISTSVTNGRLTYDWSGEPEETTVIYKHQDRSGFGFFIYDSFNNKKMVHLKPLPVSKFHVDIDNGDEIVTVTYEDTTFEVFDSNISREMSYDDGGYDVDVSELMEWAHHSCGRHTMSYSRQFHFVNRETEGE